MLRLSRDVNGNKTLVCKGTKDCRGFSVQTLGNLPRTHRMDNDSLNEDTALNELNGYIKIYGTERQKRMLGW